MLKVSYLYPEVHNCCENWSLPAPICIDLSTRKSDNSLRPLDRGEYHF